MSISKKICSSITAMLLAINLYSQKQNTDELIITAGSECPNIEIDGVNDFSSKKVHTDDLKGKWVMLDFWDKNCLLCIESLPKINALQKKYKNEVLFLLIGKQDEDNGIRMIYEKFKRKLNLQIANTFDSSLFRKLNISTTPRIIVIAPDGVVYGVTYSLNDETLSDLITGKQPELKKVHLENEEQPVLHSLSDTDEGKDTSLLFRSILNKWNPSIKGGSNWKIIPQNGYFETIGSNINNLYMLAYFSQDGIGPKDSLYGKVYGSPVYEAAGKQTDQLIDSTLYCYRITVPYFRNTTRDIMQIMQNDLKNYFEYTATIEAREMPCFMLVADEKAKIKLVTKGGARMMHGRIDTGFIVKNYLIKDIISLLHYVNIPIIDQTGINGRIDLELKYLLTNFEDIQKGLNENGLYLVKGRKKMKVLVIRKANYASTDPMSD